MVNSKILSFLFRVHRPSGEERGLMLHTDGGGWREGLVLSAFICALIPFSYKEKLFIYVISARFHAPEYIRPEKFSDTLLVTAGQGL